MSRSARGKLDALKPSPRERTRRRRTDEEVLGILSAYQRGVSMAEIARTLNANRANIYSAVGSWALRSCRCHQLRKGRAAVTPAELLAALVALSIVLAILAVWGRPRLLLPREPEGRVRTGWRPRTKVRPGRGPMDWRDL